MAIIRNVDDGLRNVEMLIKAGRRDWAKQMLAKIEMLYPKKSKYAEKRRKKK